MISDENLLKAVDEQLAAKDRKIAALEGLVRDVVKLTVCFLPKEDAEELRAHIAKELNSTPQSNCP